MKAFTEADEEARLSPDDLMMLADAYWWTGQPSEAEAAFERAFQGHLDEDRRSDAASVGALLAYTAMRRGAQSVTTAWMSRIRKLLEDEPESPGHAWLNIMELAVKVIGEGDLESSLPLADETIELAKRLDLIAVQAMAMSFKGVALVYKGEWREGVSLIDEATVLAITSRSDLRTTSDVYCMTIGACSTLADYRRAGEWTEQAERWMRANSVGGFPGICQVHRAELKRVQGWWPEAEETARRACEELEKFHLLDGIGFAHYEIGEVRRSMGDLDAAEEAFTTAYQYGHSAQPGMSLLLLDRGQTEEAARAIATALDNTRPGGISPSDVLSRAHLLPAQVEISIAAGDRDTARQVLEELEQVAETFGAPTWEATALTCRGSLELSESNPEAAQSALDKAWRMWHGIDLPYESARARELLGRARAALGDERAANLELRAAHATYKRLGATLDLARVEHALGIESEEPRTERAVKSLMFTDIVTSTDLIGVIGDEAWDKLLAWHDKALREEFSTHHGDEVRHTGDGFFITFNSARDAIDCAVAIQRRLASHRVEHGFSPSVRIGIHRAEAFTSGGDYSGKGVHTAARIGDLANTEEILVSTALLEDAGDIPYQVSEPRPVDLKGVTEPVAVQSIAWRE